MPAHPRPVRLWLLRFWRLLVVAIALVFWFVTQGLLARRAFPAGHIHDALFDLTAGAHNLLFLHPRWADALLIASSLGIDALAVFLVLRATWGPTFRPFVGLLVLIALRQVCQALIALPAPEGLIWRYPGFPSLLVTYGTSSDLFFSGHTAISVYAGVELARLRRRGLAWLGAALAIFEATAVLLLRAHYTMDIFAGAMTALWVAGIADRLAAPVDRLLVRLARVPSAASAGAANGPSE